MQRFKSFLTEAVSYEELFNALWKSKPEIKAHTEEFVKSEIKWAKGVLKKLDAVTWYLLWVRAALVSEWGDDKTKAALLAKFNTVNPTLTVTDLKSEVFSFVKRNIPKTHTELEHFYSMNIPAITKFKFINYVSYENTIFGALKALETEYMDGHEASIPYQKQPLEHHDPYGDSAHDFDGNPIGMSKAGISIIKQFPHDYYWVNLKKSSCSLEGDAMGHCGNQQYGRNTTDTVLSFRKLVKRGKDESTWLWEPHMTFILDTKGFLGEMKGRANEKPVEEYYKYIIPLLEDPMIKGLKGGGYDPENNFMLSDLSDEQREKLFAKKPALMNIKDFFKKFGKTPELIEKINAAWENIVKADSSTQTINLVWDDSTDHAAIAKYVSIQDFTQDFGDDTAKWVGDTINGGEVQDFDVTDTDMEAVVDLLDSRKVEAYLEEKFPAEWEEDEGNSSLLEFIRQHDDELYTAINIAAGDGQRSGAEGEMMDDFKKALRDIDVIDDDENEISSAYVNKDDIWDEPLFIYMTFQQIYATVVDPDTEKGIEFKFKVTEPHYGWQGWDEEAALEYMKQEYQHLV